MQTWKDATLPLLTDAFWVDAEPFSTVPMHQAALGHLPAIFQLQKLDISVRPPHAPPCTPASTGATTPPGSLNDTSPC